jgi:outer membrane protein TolC
MRAVRARYEAGLLSYLEVLDMQREEISARQNSEQIRRSQLEVAVQLYKAVGGG